MLLQDKENEIEQLNKLIESENTRKNQLETNIN